MSIISLGYETESEDKPTGLFSSLFEFDTGYAPESAPESDPEFSRQFKYTPKGKPMSSLAERLMKKTSLSDASVMSKSTFFGAKETILTDVPVINLALSGYLDQGFSAGLTVLAGPSKHFKSALGLLMCAAYQKKYQDSIILFYDSEFGSSAEYFAAAGVDTDRVIHIPIRNIEELKFDIMQKLEEIGKSDKVCIFIDSIGNLASKKEVEDALSEKSVADMTRAKQLKSLFRMVTPHLTISGIPMIAINHVYEEIGMFPKTIVGGGCLVKDTMVTMGDDTCKPIQDIKVGDLVKTLQEPKLVTNVWTPETLEFGKPNCQRITFSDDSYVECSDQHPFLVMHKDGSRFWVDASDIRVGSEIVSVKNILTVVDNKYIGVKPVFDITVDDVKHYILENGAVTHNTGIMYSAQTVFIIGRRQVKNEGESQIQGWEFVLNIEKSRCIREKSAIPFTVTYEGGIEKYSGLLEIARVAGFVVSEKKGWYTRPSVPSDRNWRRKETMSEDFWGPLLEDPSFNDAIHNMYKLGSPSKLTDDLIEVLVESTVDDSGEIE